MCGAVPVRTVAGDTLALVYPLPTAGRVRDFHPLVACAHAGRIKGIGGRLPSDSFQNLTFKSHQQAALFCIEAAQAAGLANGHLGIRKFCQHQFL